MRIRLVFVENLLGDTRQFSGSFLEFLFKGTRGLLRNLLKLRSLSLFSMHTWGSFVQQTMKFGGFEKKRSGDLVQAPSKDNPAFIE